MLKTLRPHLLVLANSWAPLTRGLTMTLVVLGLGTLLSTGAASAEGGLQGASEIPLIEEPLRIEGVETALRVREIAPTQTIPFELTLILPEHYKAYEEQFKIKIAPGSSFLVGQTRIEPMVDFYDDFSKRQRRGMIGTARLNGVLEAPAELPSQGTIPLEVTYQACTKTFCLFPKTVKVEMPFRTLAGAAATQTPSATDSVLNSPPRDLKQAMDQGLLWALLFVFGAGILTSLTPCVFPMIPITLAVLTKGAHRRSRWRTLLMSVTYVLGLALTYAVLGVLAASTGQLFGALFTSTWFLAGMCLMFFLMAMSLFGAFEVQLPLSMQNRLSKVSSDGGHPGGAFLAGALAGVVASPCVGPVLVAILTYVAQTKNQILGFWLLFVFALGMSLLLLALGLSTSASKLLPKSGAWMDSIKEISGTLMLGVFYYYLSFILSDRWFDAALGAGLVALGAWIGSAGTRRTESHSAEAQAASRWVRIKKGLALAALIVGSALIVVAALDLRPQLKARSVESPDFKTNSLQWKPLTNEALAKAQEAGRPVLIDFFAEWCAACHELDQKTFTNQQVQLMAQQFELLRFDATKDSPEFEEYRKKFKILGLPWVVFVDRQGNYIDTLTLTGFEPAGPFLERMNKALQQP